MLPLLRRQTDHRHGDDDDSADIVRTGIERLHTMHHKDVDRSLTSEDQRIDSVVATRVVPRPPIEGRRRGGAAASWNCEIAGQQGIPG